MSDRRLPGFVERDGQRRVRVMAGLELTRTRAVLALLGVVVLFAVPDLTRFLPGVKLLVVHQGLLFGFAAVGLNLLLRHTRLVSFGHAAFFGAGAYATAVLATQFEVAGLFVLLLAALVAATVAAAVVGYLSLRHTGLYFALLTLAFGQLLYAIAQSQQYLGGSDGLPVRPGPGRGGSPTVLGQVFAPEVYELLVYYLTVVVVLVGLLVMYRLANSPFGNALDAIGQDRTRARFIGIPTRKYVWTAFVISGVYGGIAGGLYGLTVKHVRPEATLHFLRSGEILFMAILGGFQTLLGPLVGGVVFFFLKVGGRTYTDYFNALTGVVLLLVVFGFPRGIVGSLGGEGGVRTRAAEVRAEPAVVFEWASAGVARLAAAARTTARNVRSVFGGT